MAITSAGYEGSISETQWAKMASYLGADYCVGGASDWQVTLNTVGDRMVNVAPGFAYGYGVMDENTSTITKQFEAPASGSRWDAVVIRRDWVTPPTGGVTTVEVVKGSVIEQVPGALLANPGAQADQVIALVQTTAGQTRPTGLIDLRQWTAKTVTLSDLRAYPNAPLGMVAVVDGLAYRRQMDSAGRVAWVTTGQRTWRGQVWDGKGGPYKAPVQSMIAPPLRRATGDLDRSTTMVPGPTWNGAGKALTPPSPGTYRIVWHPRLTAQDPARANALAFAQIRLNPTTDPGTWEIGDPFTQGWGTRIAEDISPMSAGAPQAEVEWTFAPGDRFMAICWADAACELSYYNLHSWLTLTKIPEGV